MTGALIVNGFLQSEKFNEIYQMLSGAFFKRGVKLNLYTNAQFNVCYQNVDVAFTPLKDEKFIIFWDKDVLLCEYLESLGLPTFNSSTAINLCDNKRLTAVALAKANILTPKTIITPKTFDNIGYTTLNFIEKCGLELGYPFVIKEAFGSFGKQVYLVSNLAEAKNLVLSLNGKELVFQKFIKGSSGKDLRVNVVGGKVICAIERFNPNDFRSNISNGGSMKQATPTKQQIELALSACKALNVDFAGVDILTDASGYPLVCEVNSNPHFKSTLTATGIDLSQSIADYVLGKL